MMYRAPVERLLFDLETIAGTFAGGDVDKEEMSQILYEAARFAQDRLVPLDRLGDVQGAKFENGRVTVPAPFVAAYKDWAGAGWNGADAPETHGGMGLPVAIASALMEIWHSACMSFGLGPVLTQGAGDVLHLHASEDVRARYLPRMVSGEWAGTMNLTEPGAGSDLGALSTRAERHDDGTYRITGTKIFITCGEHDYTENIIHLVLARLPDAPQGTRGISLFLVPKILVDENGALGAANDVRCAGIENKAGIHASPTCVMAYGDNGGAIGYLIGEENRGLAAMFTMMNKARLYTALQGTSVAERATQRAFAYARERRQGSGTGTAGQVAIIQHPDVRRMLLTMRALTSAARALIFAAAGAIDRQRQAKDDAARARFDAQAALLTPIAKTFCSEIGVEVASIGVQVHGGMGYVEETGAIQHWRDSRIVPIYEGTNGIQAIDLVLRKLPLLGGQAVASLIEQYRQAARDCGENVLIGSVRAGRLGASVEALAQATDVVNLATGDDKLALATPYIGLFGVVSAAGTMASGLIAGDAEVHGAAYEDAATDLAFYIDAILPRATAFAEIIKAGSASALSPSLT